MVDRIEAAVSEILERFESEGQRAMDEVLERHADIAEAIRRDLGALADIGLFVPTSSPPPATIGDYELRERLGRGGMSEVFAARHRTLGRVVALKVLRGGGSQSERRAFQREARAVAELEHPNIARVFEVDFERDPPFLAMQLVPGRSLDEHIAAGPLAVRDAARWMRDVAAAMAAAHERGLVHRDVKPSNIRVHEHGHAMLLDFGLVLAVGETIVSVAGSFSGSPAYAAPEQITGDDVGPAADQFGLGATFYEAVTGRRAFEGDDTREVFHRILGSDPPPPSRLRPDLPRDFEAILSMCLQKSPADRYPSAAALRQDLDAFLEFRPIMARRPGVTGRLRRWVRRNPGRAAGAFAGAALALAASTTLWLQERRYVADLSRAERIANENLARANDIIHYAVFDLHNHLQDIGRLDLLEGLSRRVIDYFAQLPPEFVASTPLSDRVRAGINLADSLTSAGDFKAAVATLRRMLASAESDAATGDADLLAADCLLRIAGLQRARGEPQAARNALDRARAIVDARRQRGPDTPRLRLLAGRTYLVAYEIALAYGNDRDLAGISQRQLDAVKPLLEVEEPPAEALQLALSAHMQLGKAAVAAGGNASRADAERSVALAEQLSARQPHNPEVRRLYVLALKDASATAKPRAALALLEKSRGILEELIAAAPRDARIRAELAGIGIDEGMVHRRLGDHKRAADCFAAARDRFVELLAREPVNDVNANQRLWCDCMVVDSLVRAGLPDRARAHLEAHVAADAERLERWNVVGIGALVRAFAALGDRAPVHGRLRAIEIGCEGLRRFPDSMLLGIVVARQAAPLAAAYSAARGELRDRVRTALRTAGERLKTLQPPAAAALLQAADELSAR